MAQHRSLRPHRRPKHPGGGCAALIGRRRLSVASSAVRLSWVGNQTVMCTCKGNEDAGRRAGGLVLWGLGVGARLRCESRTWACVGYAHARACHTHMPLYSMHKHDPSIHPSIHLSVHPTIHTSMIPAILPTMSQLLSRLGMPNFYPAPCLPHLSAHTRPSPHPRAEKPVATEHIDSSRLDGSGVGAPHQHRATRGIHVQRSGRDRWCARQHTSIRLDNRNWNATSGRKEFE
eukprot:364677-Chlamydomonas_euryale.AAC.4